jgi:ABC-type uncharacterized transport system auxiliary subunit
MNRKFVLFLVGLTIATTLAACNSNKNSNEAADTFSNQDNDERNKEEMMPDTTTNLLEYDSTKTKTGR